jgi:acetoacetyl-CoA synthetase
LLPPQDTRIVLFVQLTAGARLDTELGDRIRRALREKASPRHVPRVLVEVTDIPRTLSGKISERAVSDAVHGREIANLAALANPDSVALFRARPAPGS